MMKFKNKHCEIILDKPFWKSFKKNKRTIISNEFSNISGSNLPLNKTIIDLSADILKISIDNVGSVPLFYSKLNDKYIISDNAFILLDKLGKLELDNQAYEEIFCLKHTLGEKTLHKKIKLIESGTQIEFSENNITKKRNILFKKKTAVKKSDYKNEFFKILDDVFDDTLKNINGNIVIPLSGGWDSRLLAVMIKEKAKNKKVITYTYGGSYNSEVKTSEKVAKKLGFEWHFVKYTPELIDKRIKSKEFKEEILYNFNLCMTPHLRDNFAIKYLLDNKIIKQEDTIMPGFISDVAAGSRIKNLKNRSKKETIFDFLSLNSIRNPDKKIKDKIKNMYDYLNNKKNFDILETMDHLERQPKFLISSLRIYDYFKIYWKIPFGDIRLVNFWNEVPNNLRLNKKAYLEFCKELFVKHNVNFDRGKNLKGNNKLIDFIHRRLSPKLKTLISYFLRFKTPFLNLEKNSSLLPVDRRELLKNTKYENKITTIAYGVFVDMALNEIEKNYFKK